MLDRFKLSSRYAHFCHPRESGGPTYRDLAMVAWYRDSRLRGNDVARLGELTLALVWPELLALENSVILPGQALKNNALSANTTGGEHE
jgi:hypothetical protein